MMSRWDNRKVFNREDVFKKAMPVFGDVGLRTRASKDERGLTCGIVAEFFTGLSMEQNLSSGRASMVRKIDDLMKIARDCD
jgi:hypothetical protein